MDEREEIHFLRDKATQLRAVVRKYKLPADSELIQIAEDFERLARDMERRR